MRNCLRTIHRYDSTDSMCLLNHLFDRVYGPESIRYMIDGNDLYSASLKEATVCLAVDLASIRDRYALNRRATCS